MQDFCYLANVPDSQCQRPPLARQLTGCRVNPLHNSTCSAIDLISKYPFLVGCVSHGHLYNDLMHLLDINIPSIMRKKIGNICKTTQIQELEKHHLQCLNNIEKKPTSYRMNHLSNDATHQTIIRNFKIYIYIYIKIADDHSELRSAIP